MRRCLRGLGWALCSGYVHYYLPGHRHVADFHDKRYRGDLGLYEAYHHPCIRDVCLFEMKGVLLLPVAVNLVGGRSGQSADQPCPV